MRISIAGATGRTGRLIVEMALARGHTVRALIRQGIPILRSPNLTWVTGTIDDVSSVRGLIEDAEVVLSAIGPRPDRVNTCSVSTAHLIVAGAPRLLVVSGMGVTLPGDQKTIIDKAASAVVRLLSPEVFADKVLELGILQRSPVSWTAVRVGALNDGEQVLPVKADAHRPPGFRINRGSLAAFCVSEAEEGRFIRQAPFVAL